MEAKTAREMQAALAKPFAPEDLEWRLQNTNEEKMRGMAVPYVTNRAIQNRLDEVCGPENWYNEFKPWHSNGKKDSQLCGIAIHFEGKGFITKWDGAEDSDIEPIKGGLSDSMKRAAYQWGIGRVLYSLDTVWVDIERRGKSYVIKDSERRKLDNAYLSTLESLGLEPAKACGIQSLLTPKTASEQNTANDKVPPITHGQEPQQAKSGSAQPVPRAQEHPAQSPAAPAQTQRTQPPAQDRSDGQGGKTVSFGGATQIAPAIELYTVLGAKVQGGMSGSNTLVDGTVAIKRGSNDILSINRSGNCISQICIVERRAIIVEKENNSIYAGYFGNSNRIIVLQTCNIRSINIPDKVHIAGL